MGFTEKSDSEGGHEKPIWTVCKLKKGLDKKEGFGVFDGGSIPRYLNAHYDNKSFCQFSLKCPLKYFVNRIFRFFL